MGKNKTPSLPPIPVPPTINAPNLPSVPGLSPEELQAIQAQGVTLGQLSSLLEQERAGSVESRNLLRNLSGLYNPDGTINTGAVNDLRARTLGQQQQEELLGQGALGYLQGSLNPSELETLSNQVGLEEANQYLRALQGGDQPLSAALQQQEQERFTKLKEAAGQRGIRITGNDLFSASADSTAGNQLLSQLRKESQFNRETQRENALSRLQGANLNRLGFGLQRQGQLFNQAQGLRSPVGQGQLAFLGESNQINPSALSGSYAALAQSQGQAANPFAQQRELGYENALLNADYQFRAQQANAGNQYDYALANYNRGVQNQANRTSRSGGVGSLIGGGLGLIATGGNPLGFGIGAGIGGSLGQSGLRGGDLTALGLGGLGAYGLYNSFNGLRSGSGYR